MTQQYYIKPEVQRLVNRYLNQDIYITYEEYKSMTMNSYERAVLYPIMDDNCLIQVCLQHQNNFSPTTYEESANHLLFPLLIERLKRTL